MPTVRFFFDAGSGGLLWPISEPDWQAWGSPIDPGRLPVREELRDEVVRLVDWYDKSLNWDYPPDPGPWRQPECDRFNETARRTLLWLRQELGPDWEIVDGFQDLHEDPDLDRYLGDPRGFRR
jgi:hypothetical protein